MAQYPMPCNKKYGMEPFGFPETMVREFTIEYLDDKNRWFCMKDKDIAGLFQEDVEKHMLDFFTSIC